ncbi:hypothetical protein BGZ73_002250 [Actinomortierella ambigua]|nr:hypothetical protein BGZ73_002250 [Actinomortierella ambigua]
MGEVLVLSFWLWRSDDDIQVFHDLCDMFSDSVLLWCLGKGTPCEEKRLNKESAGSMMPDDVFSNDTAKTFAAEQQHEHACARDSATACRRSTAPAISVDDADMTVDSSRIASRAIPRAYLNVVRNMPQANTRRDRRKVGDHCLSRTMDGPW